MTNKSVKCNSLTKVATVFSVGLYESNILSPEYSFEYLIEHLST